MGILICKHCGNDVRVLSKHGAALSVECDSCGMTSASMVSTYLANLRGPDIERVPSRPARPEVIRARPPRQDEVDQRKAS